MNILDIPQTTETKALSAGASGRGSSMKLSSGQERLWILQQLDKTSTALNIPVALRFSNGVDFETLDGALRVLVERHPLIRCVFDADGSGVPFARYVPDFHIPVIHRISGSGESDWRAQANELLAEPFDLAATPPVRAMVVECPNDSAMVCMVFHHLLIDARSIEILIEELVASYQSATLAPLSVSYEDFVTWQRSTFDEKTVAEGLEFWRRELDGFEPLQLPTDHPSSAEASFESERIEFEFSEALTKALSEFAMRERCTLTSTVGAVFQALLSVQSGQTDITVGVALGGRENRRFSDVFGFFANTVVMRSNINPSMTFRELLRLGQQKIAAAHSHQQVPFEQVVAAVQPERKPGHNPIFSFAFTHAGEFASLSKDVSREQWSTVAIQFDIELFTYIKNNKLHGSLGFRTSLFRRETVAGFAKRFVQFIEQGLENPDEPICQYNLLTPDEVARSEARWRAASRPAPKTSRSERPPANDVEEKLCTLFADVIGLDRVSVCDNFFELGGHSLLAVSLVSNINSSLEVEVSLGDIFQAQTVEQLAKLIKASETTNFGDVLLPLRAIGVGTPVFFIHPGVGLGLCYAGFTQHLTENPVYALQARAVSDINLLAPTLRDMALDYIEQIRGVCPKGPFRLAGWSFGANVAHTIAAILQETEEEVEAITIIDGYPYAGNPPDASGLDFSEEVEDLDSVRRLHLNSTEMPGVDDQRAAELAVVLGHNKMLAETHTPPLFKGDVLFFRAMGHPDTPALKPSAWQPFITGSIRTFDVPVEHHNMMQPEALAQIAGVLGEELANANSV